MYAQAGAQLSGDPYQVEGYSRQAIKKVSLVLANANNLGALKSQISLSGRPEYQKLFPEIKRRLTAYREAHSKGLVCTKPSIPSWFDSFIEELPEGVSGEALLSALRAKHPAIADRFGETDIGLRLQRLDSEIMAHALKSLCGVPVLPIHDSIRCKVSDSERVRDAMLDAGREVVGADLVATLTN